MKNYINKYIENELFTLKNHNSKLYSFIEKERYNFLVETAFKAIQYHKNIYAYKQFISLIPTIVKKIAIPNNSISYSKVIENLIFDGYLSYMPYSKKEDLNPLNIWGYLGIDTILNEACCRHFSGIQKDIFALLNLHSSLFICYKHAISQCLIPPVDSDFQFLISNHVANA